MRQVNLVNHRDEIIGQTDLLDAHRGMGKKHQAVSLFLFRRKTDGQFELLVQQRSKEKLVGALQWANTLCANVLPNETHTECLKRRLTEELGLTWQANWPVNELTTLDYQVACENGFAENELDHFFGLVIDEDTCASLELLPNPSEVLNTAWLDWSQVKAKAMGGRVITPWLDLFLDSPELIIKIDQFLISQKV